MGAECSQPCDEDDGSTPLDAWRAFGLIDFPEHDDEDDTDIDCVRPGIFLGGMEGAMNVPVKTINQQNLNSNKITNEPGLSHCH